MRCYDDLHRDRGQLFLANGNNFAVVTAYLSSNPRTTYSSLSYFYHNAVAVAPLRPSLGSSTPFLRTSTICIALLLFF